MCVLSSLTKSGGVNGGTTAAVRHKYGFGNTQGFSRKSHGFRVERRVKTGRDAILV